MRPILVTGGAGFIGVNFVRQWLEQESSHVVVVDKLTYAGNYASLEPLFQNPETRSRLTFVQADIADRETIGTLLKQWGIRQIVHFAAESHVDRSIDGPEAFVQTNVVGTFHLLEEVRFYWKQLSTEEKETFRFLHVSTDEVFGSLGEDGKFSETTSYDPRSPYSASKAASDFFVRACFHTYGLPVLLTNCSNNYGPYQFPEKLIPLMILNCLEGKPLPVYGTGKNVRDWLYVEDHCSAIRMVLKHGNVGESYNIGGNCERTNLEIVQTIAALVEQLTEKIPVKPCAQLITFVQDRPGHDLRYAMDISKIQRELGWMPTVTFEEGIEKTVQWYLTHTDWTEPIFRKTYQRQRLGMSSVAEKS